MPGVHEFEKVELFAYTTPDQALAAQADILQRAESMLQELELRYRVLDFCTGDLGGRRPERSTSRCIHQGSISGSRSVRSVGSATTRLAGPRSVTARAVGVPPVGAHGQRIGARVARSGRALIENNRQSDGTVLLPECLAPYVGGELLIKAP